MTDIPEDVMNLAAKVVDDAEAECRKERYLFGFPTAHGKETLDKHIARAIMADRAAQAERMARMEEAVSFVARWAWRTDPPNATGHLTDTDRLSCIKHHPTIKNAAQPHIELAEAEAARALSQEGSDA